MESNRLVLPQLESAGKLAQAAASTVIAASTPITLNRLKNATVFDTPELRNGVIAALMKWMAAGYAFDPHPAALDHAILFDGLIGIHRAGRLIDARRWQGR